MAMASSPPLDSSQLPSPQTPSPLPLSTSCLFPPALLSHRHRSASNPPTPPDDPLLRPSTPIPPHLALPPPHITGSTPASTSELSVVGSPQKRSFYSTFNATEEILEDDTLDECIQPAEKRTRRLTLVQVKALEKAFELDNRLDPDRKEHLAKQLDLQPRQVAVWFQNRRARWKTKQMEKDYNSLKKKLEALKADKDELMKEKEKLKSELIRLKNDVKNRETVKLEEATEAGRIAHSEISSCVTPRENCEFAELTSDQKDKDGSSTTCDSDGSAIDNVDTPTRTQNSFALSTPGNVICSGDTVLLMQAETDGFLDLPDLYHGRVAYGPRPMEDMFCEEGEGYSGFVHSDWWDAD